jgi:hypothetical protein
MEKILEQAKEYEVVVIESDPLFNNMIDAIELVKKFIIDNGLIIYGGLAIDYALRLRGDKIYPDDLPPDLDFFSPKNVEHAYQLADLLYTRGYKDSRAINAMHMETMRVDIGDNHFIADITYRPKEIFDKLPTLNYNGMKIIHPMIQRADVHSSLSFPYDNVPNEVIFARWSKDIKRFNLLDKHYPVKLSGDTLPTRPMKITADVSKYVVAGFCAYSILYSDYIKSMEAAGTELPVGIIEGKFIASSNEITFDTIDQKFEIVHFDLEKCSGELSLVGSKQYETYIHVIPERLEGRADFGDITVYSTKNRLVSTNYIKTDGKTFRVVNAQYLLKHFVAMSFVHKESPKLANTYLAHYDSLLRMISSYEAAIVSTHTTDEAYDILFKSPLFPSVQTYGNENISLSKSVALSYLYHDLDGEPLFVTPRNYYPGRSIPQGRPHPEFTYEDNPFFLESGREITADKTDKK